ncbi:MAG TPA: hypothetical protein VHF22_10945 [Planctomycetota bacterium]|nr:hypothetical protein [Planctomycetota bacterium]
MGIANAIGQEIGRRTGLHRWVAGKLVGAGRGFAHALASPIVSIELAAAFRRKRFLVAFTLALLVVVAILITIVAYNVTERPARVGQYVFLGFSITLAFVILALFPAFSCASIVEERVNRSLDLLLVTKLEPWEIFTGKLSAALVYCVMYLAASMPVVGLSFIFGGIAPEAILVVYAAMLAGALLICAVGTYASATAGTFIRAIVASYLLSWLMSAIFLAALVPILAEFVAQSWGLIESRSQTEFETLFKNFGAHIYSGVAFVWVAIVLFFTLAGANRLKPVSYDRSTSMRAFAVFALGGIAVFDAATAREVAALGATVNADFAFYAVVRLCIAAGFLFIPVLVFSTERADLSRRVQLELAGRFRLSPMRLLAPGPARGALFSTLLAAAILLGYAHEAGRAFGLSTSGLLERGDLTLRDLALVLLAFLAFLAAFGRLLAEYATGTVAPRLAVAGLAVVLLLAPILALVADEDSRPAVAVTPGAASEPPPPEGIPPSIAHGYLLSPILAGLSAVSVPNVADRPRYYLRPDRLPPKTEATDAQRAGPFSASEFAAQEAEAIPIHRAATVLYAGLAAALWLWAARRARMRAREPAFAGAAAG